MTLHARALALALLACAAATAQAGAPFATGVGPGAAPLAPGATDPHYTVSGGGLVDAPAYATHDAAGYPGYWLQPDGSSSWITPVLSGTDAGPTAATTYTYTTRFDLSGHDPAATRIDGLVAVDDQLVAVLLNGQDMGVQAAGYGSFHPFALSEGFVAGLNTLSFVVSNAGGGPTGLRTELQTLLSPVPEPASALLMAGGALLLRACRRAA